MEIARCGFMTRRLARLRGLLGRAPDRSWHVLAPCNDVHTFGMGHELDVAFIDAEGRVLAVHRQVGKGRRLRCSQAAATVERFARGDPWLMPGDRVGLTVAFEEGPAADEEGTDTLRKEER